MAIKLPSVRNRYSKADKSLKVRRARARSVIGRIADAVLPSCIRSRVLPWQSSSSNNDVIPGVIEEISIISDDAQNKLGTESLRSELHCASKQIADLRDKLDYATCELAAEKRKNKTLSVNLDDARHQHREIVAVNDRLSRSIKDMETDERNVAMESCQEAENELHNSKTETHNLQSMLNDRNEQCRQLLENLEDRDSYVEMLQDQLESAENRARDTLVSQGAEITVALLPLSELSNRLKCVIKSTILANSLSEEEVRKLWKANRIKKDTKHGRILTIEDSWDNETARIVNEINSVNIIIRKFTVISGFDQFKLKSQLKQLESDKKDLEKQLQNNRSKP